MHKALIKLPALSLLLGVAPAMAADFSEANPVVSPPAAAPSPSTTLGFEFDPELAAKSGSIKAGNVSDYFGKFQIAHSFAGGWVASGFLQSQYDLHPGKSNLWRYYGEADLGYKIKLGNFTLTPSAGIGDVWGDSGVTKVSPSAVYYAFYLAGDLKLDTHWTWNVFNARYRDAFNYRWITPKIATGVTYNINAYNAVYGTVGYGWKDTGSGLIPSTINVGAGYKVNF
jgi:hypothetical protein